VIGPHETRRFFIVGGDGMIYRMMAGLSYQASDSIEKAGIVFFTGGADVDPSLYGEKKHRCTHSDINRDIYESQVYSSLRKDVLKIGICRGAQFLNVMNGGKLWQHSDHPGIHHVFVSSFVGHGLVEVNSTHHQIMRLNYEKKFHRLAYADAATFREDGEGNGETFHEKCNCKVKDDLCPCNQPDEEVIYYPDTRCLCFQPHPEYGHHSTTKLFENCLKHVLEDVWAFKED
jgi:hypothetical protein